MKQVTIASLAIGEKFLSANGKIYKKMTLDCKCHETTVAGGVDYMVKWGSYAEPTALVTPC